MDEQGLAGGGVARALSTTAKVLDSLSATEPIYAVLDGARDPGIVPWIGSSRAPAWCLYAGKVPPVLQNAAPWLLRIGRGHGYTEELFQRGWGQSWGFFFSSSAPSRSLRRQLRQSLLARTEDGRRLVFRYYDPRVLRVYLPTCTPDELRTFFGPISGMLVENPDGSALVVRHPDGEGKIAASARRGAFTW